MSRSIPAPQQATLRMSGALLRRCTLGLGRAMVGLTDPLRRAWQRRRDARMLADLSDHQLRDIGLSRLDIPGAVRRGGPI